MIATRFVIAAAAVLCATVATAQTPGQLLEKAIFSEETAGDLDLAISIYERLLSTPDVPREVAARAQAHLSSGRQRREHAATAAALLAQSSRPHVLFERSAQAQPQVSQTPALLTGGCCGVFSDNYDPGRGVTVNGSIIQVEWSNPQTVVHVHGADGRVWGFAVESPNTMIRSGWNRNTLKLGEQLLVSGYLAKGRGQCPAPLPNACETLMSGALHASASTIVRDNTTIFDRVVVEEQMRRLQEELERSKAPAAGR